MRKVKAGEPKPLFLTGVFKLKPTAEQAAQLEDLRARTERMYWLGLAFVRNAADRIAGEPDTDKRKVELENIQKKLTRQMYWLSAKEGWSGAASEGVSRGVIATMKSYIGLKRKGQDAGWPVQPGCVRDDYARRLDEFAACITEEDEKKAAAALMSGPVVERPPHPFALPRGKDVRILKIGEHIFAAVNMQRAVKGCKLEVPECIDVVTGKKVPAFKSGIILLIRMSVSKWHTYRFLSGKKGKKNIFPEGKKTDLVSALIRRKDDSWFLQGQFHMQERPRVHRTGKVLGVDRGVANTVAMAVVDARGNIKDVPEPYGSKLAETIRSADGRARRAQKRGSIAVQRHKISVDQQLHAVANEIVRQARIHGARISVENLDAFKTAIVTKRKKGARKGGVRKVLTTMQLRKLESMLEYKLRNAGLPDLCKVFPGGTSITCIKCRNRDAKSRKSQSEFQCTMCGFTANADSVAAVNIARRLIAREMMPRDKKGRLAPYEFRVVDRLWWSGNNCGIGSFGN